jgi:4-hydroxybenzoate polyprenyltransferase
MRTIISFLVYSNIWIAIAAVAMYESGYLLLGLPMQFDTLAIMCFLGTWSVYLLIRVSAVSRIRQYAADKRWTFFLQNLKILKWVTAGGLIACAVMIWWMPISVQLVLLLPAAISLIYGLPIGKKGMRLRDMGIIKIFLIAFVWAFTGSFLPAANAGGVIFNEASMLLFAAQFLFIFGITLPFDVKDLENDTLHGVRTIPGHLGEDASYTLAFIVLFTSAALHQLMQRQIMDGSVDLGIPVGVSILISGLVVHATRKRRSEMLYFFVLDGTILLQFLLLFSFKQAI